MTPGASELWLVEDWKGNDKPYRSMRRSVDTAFAKRQMTTAVLEKLRAYAESNPHDPQAQFRWGYASFLATQQYPPIAQRRVINLYPLEVVEFPHSYEYARLCFLVGTRTPDPRFEPFGEHLLAQNPRDYEVLYRTVGSFDPTLSRPARIKGLKMAHDLIRIRPHDPRSFAALGNVNYYIWSRGHDPVAKRDAISACRRYLAFPQVGPSQRHITLDIISTILRG